jgi:hypothetical protein
MTAADYNDNYSGSTEYIPLSAFGGCEAQQTLRRVGIEAVFLEHRNPPFLQIARRYPEDNPLGSFLHVYLDDKKAMMMGTDGAILYVNIATGPTRLDLVIDELLQEKTTGGTFDHHCSNISCLMPIIQGRARGEILPLSQKLRKAANDILVNGIRKQWLMIGDDIGSHR